MCVGVLEEKHMCRKSIGTKQTSSQIQWYEMFLWHVRWLKTQNILKRGEVNWIKSMFSGWVNYFVCFGHWIDFFQRFLWLKSSYIVYKFSVYQKFTHCVLSPCRFLRSLKFIKSRKESFAIAVLAKTTTTTICKCHY